MNQESTVILLMLLPLVIGGIIAAINTTDVNDTTEKAEAWARKTQTKVSTKARWYYKYIVNPFLWTIVKFCDWTDSFTHRGLKNGVRVAATIYLFILSCFILYSALKAAVMMAVILVILFVLFKVLTNSDGEEAPQYSNNEPSYKKGNGQSYPGTTNRKDDTMDYVGQRGKYVYSGSNILNEELKGRVDDEGYIYKGTTWLSEECIGRIDSHGNIYKGIGLLNEEIVGRIDTDGYLHKGTNWFNEEVSGRLAKGGDIYKGSTIFNEEKTGRTGD